MVQMCVEQLWHLHFHVMHSRVVIWLMWCRGSAINMIEVEPQRQRVITVGGDMLKLWTFKGHALIKEVRSSLQPVIHHMLLLQFTTPADRSSD